MSKELSFLTTEDRLKVYQLIVDGCHHAFSKNQLKEERANKILEALVPLTVKDPYFLAHLTSYVFQKSESKDLKLFTAYVSSLSSADGNPFELGSEYKKPDFRYIAAAALQQMDPVLLQRVLKIASRKWKVDGYLNFGKHFPKRLRAAIRKYLKYREQNLQFVKGIAKSNLRQRYIDIYRRARLNPSDEVAKILNWKQKGKDLELQSTVVDFSGLEDIEIAEKIRREKLPYMGVLAGLFKASKKMSPVIAVALLEQCSGDEAIIFRGTFEDQGILQDPEVLKLYEEKIKTAKNAIDRIKDATKRASKEVEEVMEKAKSEKRKEVTKGFGKIHLSLDMSGSMSPVADVARKLTAIFAEMVDNPSDNFDWIAYNDRAIHLPRPREFKEAAIRQALFGVISGGGTDCFAGYQAARQFGAEIDVHISDGAHVAGYLGSRIELFHKNNPSIPKPKVMVWVEVPSPAALQFPRKEFLKLKEGYEDAEIPVVVLKYDAITNSALVTEAVRGALLGSLGLVDEIMATPLLELPEWYYAI